MTVHTARKLPIQSLEEADAVSRHAPLVWSIVRRYIGRGVEREDLFQLGCIGLLKALRDLRIDASRRSRIVIDLL